MVAVLGATGLLLVLVTWAASIGPDRVVSGGHLSPAHATSPTSTVTVSSSPAADPFDQPRGHREPPAWQDALAFVLELLTLGVGLFLFVRLLGRLEQAWRQRRRRRRRGAPEEEVEFEVVGSARQVTEAIAEDAEEQRTLLEVVGEPRNAIVECWHRFELQAERAGAQRRVWQTTSEFVLAALDLVGADRGAVSELAELYREARFSDHPMTDEHRRRALEALDAIHHSLRMRVLR